MKTLSLPHPKAMLITVLLLSASLLFSACSTANAQSQGSPTPGDSKSAPIETPGSKQEGQGLSAGDLARLDPEAIVLELAYEPSFSRIEASYLYGRPPVFALLADGRVIYTQAGASDGEEQIMAAQLTRGEVVAMLQKVSHMGFDRLESFTDFCKNAADGTQQCVADADYTILRMRTSPGVLKEVKIYADFASDPEAFTSITGYLTSYSQKGAAAYAPEKAALFLSKSAGEAPAVVKAWPLDPSLLRFPETERGVWAIVLQGQALSKYLAGVDGNVGDTFFEAGGVVYRAYFVPWIPGADYSEQLLKDFPSP